MLAQQDPPISFGQLSAPLIELRKAWFARLLSVFLPSVDHLSQLPAKTAFIFGFDPEKARSNPENATVLAVETARSVLSELAGRLGTHSSMVSPEDFKEWMAEIKDATGAKGKDLYHPVRIALTGYHSGPDFDKLHPAD